MAKKTVKRKASSLIKGHETYSTTPKSKFISMDMGNGKSKYIPKTAENMSALSRLKGTPDVYDDKRFGKRFIWW